MGLDESILHGSIPSSGLESLRRDEDPEDDGDRLATYYISGESFH